VVPDDDPLRPVALVVGGLAVTFGVVLLVVQFAGGRAESVLTLPLIVALPAVFAAIYWLVRGR
jgi:hypothetical protein